MSNGAISLREKVKIWMQVAVTFVTIPGALILIFSAETTAEIKQIAAGWIGLVLGFWFGAT